MPISLPPVQWLRTFEAAARHLSFSGAAAELNLTPAAISHQVRSLESRLGFALFDRLPRGVSLTDIGRAYLPSVRKAFDDLTISTIGLFGQEHDTPLTVRAPVVFATNWLIPRLPKFWQRFPKISLRVLSAVWAETSPEVDVDIRFGDGQWPDFDVTPLLHEPSIVVCKPGAAGPHDQDDAKIKCFLEQGVVHIMGCEDRWTRLLRQQGFDRSMIRINTMTDNSLFAMQLTLAGFGPCIVQMSYAAPYLEAGTLIVPLCNGIVIDEAHYILTRRSDEQRNPEALIFREWLRHEVAGETEIAM